MSLGHIGNDYDHLKKHCYCYCMENIYPLIHLLAISHKPLYPNEKKRINILDNMI